MNRQKWGRGGSCPVRQTNNNNDNLKLKASLYTEGTSVNGKFSCSQINVYFPYLLPPLTPKHNQQKYINKQINTVNGKEGFKVYDFPTWVHHVQDAIKM